MHTLLAQLPSIQEWHDVGLEQMKNEILPAGKPAILRGLAKHWPAVTEGQRSPQAMHDYLHTLSPTGEVEMFVAGASNNGNMAYTEHLESHNYAASKVPLAHVIDRVLEQSNNGDEVVYAGSVPIAQHLPLFSTANRLSLFDEQIAPRIWIGNKVKVAAHYDLSHNVACAVRGRRRFILFPPDQIANLYIGPIDYTLGGRPASLVNFDEPDLGRFPRFVEAISSASVAELEPGDAIYIPTMWWHHVESLDALSVLVNYWWSPTMLGGDSGYDALLHGLLTISALPEHERLAWRAFFDHYVFRTDGNPADHIPEPRRGVLGAMTPGLYEYIREYLVKSMKLGWKGGGK